MKRILENVPLAGIIAWTVILAAALGLLRLLEA